MKPDHDSVPLQPTASTERLPHWIRLVQNPILISTITSTLTFLATIVLFRQLAPEDAGLFTLILAIIQLIIMVASFGQHTLIQRIYSQNSNSAFNWMKDLIGAASASIPLGFFICLIVVWVYNITFPRVALVLLTAIMQTVILIESRMLIAYRHYTWGNTLLRLPNSLLIFPALFIVSFQPQAALNTALFQYSALTTTVAMIGFGLLNKYLPKGDQSIPWKERLTGIIFLFTQSSYTFPEQAIVAIAGRILSPIELAAYGAMAVFQKPFELAASVLRTILTTELIRQRNMKGSTISIWIWGASSISTIALIFLGPTLVNAIYGSRYPGSAGLLPAFAIAGLFRLVETLPRSYVIGNANQADLRRFISWQLILASAIILSGVLMIEGSGVLSVAWLMAIIQIGRYLVSNRIYGITAAKP